MTTPWISVGLLTAAWFSAVPAPGAPALVCFNKNTGRVVWQDHSLGANILYGEWGSPKVIRVRGNAQLRHYELK